MSTTSRASDLIPRNKPAIPDMDVNKAGTEPVTIRRPHMATNGSNIAIEFMHPHESKSFKAGIGKSTTGAQAIDNLVSADFIDKPARKDQYLLTVQSTNTNIPPSHAIADYAKDGDVIAIVSPGIGA
jgi:hypothetical protein